VLLIRASPQAGLALRFTCPRRVLALAHDYGEPPLPHDGRYDSGDADDPADEVEHQGDDAQRDEELAQKPLHAARLAPATDGLQGPAESVYPGQVKGPPTRSDPLIVSRFS
jgi:hypothetical protein